MSAVRPTTISYRSPQEKSARFLNVDQLLQSTNISHLIRVYNGIYQSITAYSPAHADSLATVERALYHRIVHLCDVKKMQLTQANKGWRSVVVGVLTLGIRPLVILSKKGRIETELRKVHLAHPKFISALEQMQQRGLDKEFHPKPDKLKELESRWLSDPVAELTRLRTIPRIATSLDKVSSKNYWQTMSIRHQIALGRSIELCEQMKDTHYVINHGQNLDLMFINLVARKLKEEFEPAQYEAFEVLRHDSALRHIGNEQNVEWFREKMYYGIDHNYRKELICGDCFLESTASQESAIDFFAYSHNIAAFNPMFVRNMLKPIIADYISDDTLAQKLLDDLIKLRRKCLNEYSHKGGNLYSICVPHEDFHNSCYFAGPFGRPIEYSTEHLPALQSGNGPLYGGAPQIRILAHKIRPENGYHVILNSTYTSAQLAEIEEAVTKSIQVRLHLRPDITP